MKNNKVFVVLREFGHASPCIDGVFTSKEKANTFIKDLLEQFGESLEAYEQGNSKFQWDIVEKTLN